MHTITKVTSSLAILVLAQTTALAALTDLQNGSVYDSVHDITWTQDVRYHEIDLYPNSRMFGLQGTVVGNIDGSSHTVGPTDIYQVVPAGIFRVGGTWWGATAWATTLNFQGISGWRLPTSAELVGVISDPEYPVFIHGGSVFSYLFWTSTEVDSNKVVQVQLVSSSNPNLYLFNIPKAQDQSGGFIQVAWAVHEGNISVVPEPVKSALFLLGLAAIVLTAKRQRLWREDP